MGPVHENYPNNPQNLTETAAWLKEMRADFKRDHMSAEAFQTFVRGAANDLTLFNTLGEKFGEWGDLARRLRNFYNDEPPMYEDAGRGTI